MHGSNPCAVATSISGLKTRRAALEIVWKAIAYTQFADLIKSFSVFVAQFSGRIGRFDLSDRRLMYLRVPFVPFCLFGRLSRCQIQ